MKRYPTRGVSRATRALLVVLVLLLNPLRGAADESEDSANIEGVQHGMNVYYDGNLFRAGDPAEQEQLATQWQNEQVIIETLLDRLSNLGVNSLSLAVPIFSDAWASTRFYLDPVKTPDMAQIRFIAEQAKARDMTFMLKPLLDSGIFVEAGNPDQWRGTLQPVEPTAWFASYHDVLMDLARPVADLMDWLVIGTELTSLETPAYEPYWTSLVTSLRSEVPKAKLVYGQNWWGLGPSDHPPHTPSWISMLDAVGVSGYFPPSDQPSGEQTDALATGTAVPNVQLTDTATVEDVSAALDRYRTSIVSHVRHYGLPLLVLELGIPSQANAYTYTWTTTDAPVNLGIQVTFLAAACPFYSSMTNGIWLWYSNIHVLQDPAQDVGFELIGKPAEQSIPLCFDSI